MEERKQSRQTNWAGQTAEGNYNNIIEKEEKREKKERKKEKEKKKSRKK